MPVPTASCLKLPIQCPQDGAQKQIICSKCHNLLFYAHGASSVHCPVCDTDTTVPPFGAAMAQLVCRCCGTLLMYIQGATSVQCPCCTINLASEANRVAHINCGNCSMLLRYRYGAKSVKCGCCNFVTSTK